MNLIPERSRVTGNYICTWGAQGAALKYEDLIPAGYKRAPQGINESFLFAENGYLSSFDPEIRGDLFVVLDDGWDVPYTLTRDKNNAYDYDLFQYGSMIPDPERFPSFTGTPAERLRAISDKVKSFGYAGLGLWVCPQVCCPDDPVNPSAKNAEPYWRERFTWCREADIRYLKVDWGLRTSDADYREMLSRVAKETAPGMAVEHSLNQGFLDPRRADRNTPEYAERLMYLERLQYCSDFFRTYDTYGEFTDLTALERAAEILGALKTPEKAVSILSMEDSVYGAAAIGGTFGGMRCHSFRRRDTSEEPRPMTELTRAVHWSRIAPPFALGRTRFELNPEYSTDGIFRTSPVLQDCCLSLSRNMPLPRVTPVKASPMPTDLVPYVICSKHPDTNALAVFALPRNICGQLFYPIRADITVSSADQYAPVGIFGWYHTLRVDFGADIRYKRVWMQDLCADEAEDVTELVIRDGKAVVIPGELIDRIGLSVRSSTIEMPGVVLALTEE